MKPARVLLLFIVAILLDPAAAGACGNNGHSDGHGGCACNTGYAMAKSGKCELKRAIFTPTPDKKDKDKAAKLPPQ